MQLHAVGCALTLVPFSVLLFSLPPNINHAVGSVQQPQSSLFHAASAIDVHPAPGIATANAANQPQLGLRCQQYTFRLSDDRHSLASFLN